MYDLIIIGGGPAGTAAAITAARAAARVLLLERGRFPRHKVCGEFVSAESLQLLASLLRCSTEGEQLLQRAVRIHWSRLFSDGGEARVRIAPPAASIARFDLDVALWRAAELAGADCRQQVEVLSCQWSVASSQFEVVTGIGNFCGKSAIDASGRWSRLRNTSTETQKHTEKQDWLGLKAHYKTPGAAQNPKEYSTDLYFFEGGYCGVQPLGDDELNVSTMVRSRMATKLEEVFALHPLLHERSRNWRQATEAVATSPLIFREPVAERDGVLCAGDAAAFIDPFAGDGISLALRSGAAAALALSGLWSGEITREEAARRYREEYDRRFMHAFRAAARVRRMLLMPRFVRQLALRALHAPALAEYVVRATR